MKGYKRAHVNENNELEQLLGEVMHADDGLLGQSPDKLKAVVNRQLSEKCRLLEKKHKDRSEIAIVAVIYPVFMMFLGLLVWDLLQKGPFRTLVFAAWLIGALCLVLLCCLPLLIKFKIDTLKGERYK